MEKVSGVGCGTPTRPVPASRRGRRTRRQSKGSPTVRRLWVLPGLCPPPRPACFAKAGLGSASSSQARAPSTAQSFAAKHPSEWSRAAPRLNVPAVAVSGVCSPTGEQIRQARYAGTDTLIDIEADAEPCIAQVDSVPEQLPNEIGHSWPARGDEYWSSSPVTSWAPSSHTTAHSACSHARPRSSARSPCSS